VYLIAVLVKPIFLVNVIVLWRFGETILFFEVSYQLAAASFVVACFAFTDIDMRSSFDELLL
jgi:hypothetical protein